MVLLSVKGTKFPDAFVFECQCSDSVADVTRAVSHLQNMRHKVRLQLFSMGELVAAVKALAASKQALEEQAACYEATHQEILAAHKDATRICASDAFDTYWSTIRRLTIEAFPKECTHPDGEEAAISKLWELHENPDIDEDYRLHVYHCRAVMDPQWRENEVLDETKTALWFCGKVLDKAKTVGDLCHGNAKSKLTVKVALENGPAPAGEPRMSYDDQRSMRNHVCARRETLKHLEDSELRDRVVQQSRGKLFLANPGASSGDNGIRISGVAKRLGGDSNRDDADDADAAPLQ